MDYCFAIPVLLGCNSGDVTFSFLIVSQQLLRATIRLTTTITFSSGMVYKMFILHIRKLEICLLHMDGGIPGCEWRWITALHLSKIMTKGPITAIHTENSTD